MTNNTVGERRTVQLTLPSWADWRRRSTRLSLGRVTAFTAVVAMWAFGAYYGIVAMPDLATLGGVVGIAALVAVLIGPFWAVFNRRTWVRVLGVVIAFIGGAVLATQGLNLATLFASFTLASTVGLIVALGATIAVAWWLCSVPLHGVTPDSVATDNDR